MKSALIKLHIAVFIWGFTGVLGRFIELNEGLLVWYRILFTILALAGICYFTKSSLKIPKKDAITLMLNGCIIALHWVFFYASIKYSNVSVGVICLSLQSFFASFLEPLIRKTKFEIASLLLSLLGVLGVALIFHFDNKYRLGIAIGFISSFCSAWFSCYNKKNVEIAEPKAVLLYQLLGGWLFLTLLLPIYLYLFPTQKYLPNLKDVTGLLFLSIICTVIAMWLCLQALKKISAFTQNLTLNLEPVYGVALAFLFYHEQENLNQFFYVGMVLIFLSVVLQVFRIAKSKTN